MVFALALTTTSPVSSTAIATAPSLSKTIASSLLIAATSTISLTPYPTAPGDISGSNTPADDAVSLNASSSGSASLGGNTNHAIGNSSAVSSSSGPSRLSSSSDSGSSSAASATSAAQMGPIELPSIDPEQGRCFASGGSSKINSACCASVKGTLEQGGAYCQFQTGDTKTWQSCVSTALSGATGGIKCAGSSAGRRSKAAWLTIGLSVMVAVGLS